MRCLYCNKKLSLLKLAKGDSFCSPEHFDAHQLKLSNDAFQRLMSIPAEDTPKAPLVAKPKEEKPREKPEPKVSSQEQDAAFARLVEPPPPPAPAPKASAPITPAAKVPPYAPFARAPLPAWPPGPPTPLGNEPEVSEVVEPPTQLAFPVHDVEATVCILNLYLRLSLAGTKAADWTSERHLIVTPEYFNLTVIQPPLGLNTEFPRIENPAPIEELDPIETVEAKVTEIIKPVEAVPVVEAAPAAPPIENSPLPYLISPSFEERRGAPLVVHSLTSAVPNAPIPAPRRDSGKLPRLDSRNVIPAWMGFARKAAAPAQDSAATRLRGGSEFPIQPAFIRPTAKQWVCPRGWLPSDRHIENGQPAQDSGWTSTNPTDGELPSPESLLVRPAARPLDKVEPAQVLSSADTRSCFLGVLETSPAEWGFLFVDAPASAMEFGWRAVLGRFPAEKPFPPAWRAQTSHISALDRIASHSEPPVAALNPLSIAPSCKKWTRIENFVLPSPFVATDAYRGTHWPDNDFGSFPVPADHSLVFTGTTMLPRPADIQEGCFKTGSDAPIVGWEPYPPANDGIASLKFLPTRSGAILVEAKSWPKLESVPL